MNSGTTLLLDMLRVNPEVYSGFEFKLLFYKPSELNKWYDECNHYFQRFELNKKDLANIPQRWPDAYHSILDLIQAKVEKPYKYFIDKTPHYDVEYVHKSVPASIIGIYRDPISVFNSWRKRTDFRGTVTISEFVQMYEQFTKPLLENEYITLVRYENLVQQPAKVLQKLCSAIDLEFCSDMANPLNGQPHEKIRYKFPQSAKAPRILENGIDKQELLPRDKLSLDQIDYISKALQHIPEVFYGTPVRSRHLFI
jgi:hypothetical protein